MNQNLALRDGSGDCSPAYRTPAYLAAVLFELMPLGKLIHPVDSFFQAKSIQTLGSKVTADASGVAESEQLEYPTLIEHIEV
jgi:hypothetical protein